MLGPLLDRPLTDANEAAVATEFAQAGEVTQATLLPSSATRPTLAQNRLPTAGGAVVERVAHQFARAASRGHRGHEASDLHPQFRGVQDR